MHKLTNLCHKNTHNHWSMYTYYLYFIHTTQIRNTVKTQSYVNFNEVQSLLENIIGPTLVYRPKMPSQSSILLPLHCGWICLILALNSVFVCISKVNVHVKLCSCCLCDGILGCLVKRQSWSKLSFINLYFNFLQNKLYM